MANSEEKNEPEVAPEVHGEITPEAEPEKIETGRPRRRTRTSTAEAKIAAVTEQAEEKAEAEEELEKDVAGETIKDIRQVARNTWDRTARTTRKTASILGFKLRKAVRRKSLHDVYQEIGEIYFNAIRSGQAAEIDDPRLHTLAAEADRLKEEISDLDQKEDTIRGL